MCCLIFNILELFIWSHVPCVDGRAPCSTNTCATKGLKRKQDAGATLNKDLSIGDLVALELHVKRYSRQGEKAKLALYELAAVQMLHRGNADDANEVQASVSPAKTDAFGEDFFAT